MRFASTRDVASAVDFSAALQAGLAPDGGLYVPTSWPRMPPTPPAQDLELGSLAVRVLEPFLAADPLERQLAAIAREAFTFAAPLVTLDAAARLHLLELFHGPTAAFKDFGARFLAASLARLPRVGGRSLNMLVATSGDTGGAVAAAFHERPGMQVTVLFPKGLVSPTQERQLTCWGGNVAAFAVRGRFDDCQRLVKEALQAPELRARFDLSSANSINLGRLLPQMIYYAAASLALYRKYGECASFIIPSGNLGNAVACIWGRKLGLPISDIVLAHNANRVVPDYLHSGPWQPRSHQPWMSAIQVIWSACATSFRECPSLPMRSVPTVWTIRRSAGASVPPSMTGAGACARTRRWRRKFMPGCPLRGAVHRLGLSWRLRMRPSSGKSSNRSRARQ
jgi:threonine synthase